MHHVIARSFDRSRRLEAVDLYQAPGVVGILGYEVREPSRGFEFVQQASCQAAVQDADDRLVFADGVSVGAVAQPEGHLSLPAALALRREPEGGEGAAHLLLGMRAGVLGCELVSQVLSGALDLTQAPRTRRRAPGQPARELTVGVGWLPTRQSVNRHRPAVPRSPSRLRRPLARDESGCPQPF